MELKVTEWTVLLCFCAFGIQSSLSFVQQIREMEQNCVRDGGYCINVIPPPPPRRRNQPGRRGGRGGRGRGRGQTTRTRTGARPDPRAVAAQHTRLPGSRPPGAGAAPGGPPGGPPAGGPGGAAGRPAHQPPMTRPTGGPPNNQYNQPSGYPQQPGQTQNTGLFGSNPNDPFGSLFGMMMFSRKKRQAPAEPLDPAEQPRIRRGQRVYTFLNQHCRKSEFDFGCRREGGMCCLPFLK